MTEIEDKWMDEILEKTEKQYILQQVGLAVEYIKNLNVDKALEVLETLTKELGDVSEDIKQVEEAFKDHPISGWSQPHRHDNIHGNPYTYTETELTRALRREFEEIWRFLNDMRYETREIAHALRGRVVPPVHRDIAQDRERIVSEQTYLEMLLDSARRR